MSKEMHEAIQRMLKVQRHMVMKMDHLVVTAQTATKLMVKATAHICRAHYGPCVRCEGKGYDKDNRECGRCNHTGTEPHEKQPNGQEAGE